MLLLPLLRAVAAPADAAADPASARPPDPPDPPPPLPLLLLEVAAAKRPALYASRMLASAPHAMRPGTDMMAMEAAM